MISLDGIVTFDSPHIVITPAMTRDDFLASDLERISEVVLQNAPYITYRFSPVIILGEQFAGHICFCSSRLGSISLSSMRAEFGSSWNDFSVEKLYAQRAFQEQFLRRIFRDQKNRGESSWVFSWGEVSAIADEKSGDAPILIRYA